jgi:S-adenosylmethionine synthetase
MGRESKIVKKTFANAGQKAEIEVELFTWEKLDYIDKVKAAFGI